MLALPFHSPRYPTSMNIEVIHPPPLPDHIGQNSPLTSKMTEHSYSRLSSISSNLSRSHMLEWEATFQITPSWMPQNISVLKLDSSISVPPLAPIVPVPLPPHCI